MAQKIVTLYIDDLTGEEAEEAQTHTFSLDGVAYEIDLGPDSYEQMLQAFGPFLKAARKTGKVKGPGAARRQAKAGGEDSAKIREWAKEHGYEVSDRGRVPANVREAYEKAH
ncbi:histone-like nucleoid-structuring protein Lsr2 [Streptomyces gobiensis]|uniref:histone-like nucleoid-structuring protein Lsr2 n=1 Tax=Streptomyces gobiensis TaxID=2875706 RepID=UPI001E4696A7|nr:Lsr2 family protein [Streptomyces gobiensis]UGY94394.1 Lsr2 family protein [Streptomyces gobiensis]